MQNIINGSDNKVAMEDIALNSQKEVSTVWQSPDWKIWSHNYDK